MIELEQVTYQYPGKPPIFEDFSLSIKHNQTWVILGPSGCGKTTLLYLLAGLKHPQKGQIKINGIPLTRPRPQTGLIIQDFGLLPWATVRENATLGIRIRNFYGPDGTHAPIAFEPKHTIDYWLEKLDIQHLSDRYPSELSGGQRQRTAIARTLSLEPDLLLMDEPFSSLDAPTRESLQRLTLELQQEHNLTFILVTHNIEEAAYMGQNILLLGEPPHTNPTVFHNPDAGREETRNSNPLIGQLRSLMDTNS